MKYAPNPTVQMRAIFASFALPSVIEWWAQVTVAPDARRTAVFNRGTLNGLIGVIPVGGQVQPSSGVGASLLWKKAQKNDKKKQTSERINRIIPNRRHFNKFWVCSPINAPSRVISRHHWNITIRVISRPKVRIVVLFV